ncbi:uncharacterized protein BDV17DRAFT_272125 [Aspergillus undulatus]|uniref:uncharacterized protein n=1 Tax=Aspergillus undulatus TaxID=1810928 RepID=UPI003CCD3F21
MRFIAVAGLGMLAGVLAVPAPRVPTAGLLLLSDGDGESAPTPTIQGQKHQNGLEGDDTTGVEGDDGLQVAAEAIGVRRSSCPYQFAVPGVIQVHG